MIYIDLDNTLIDSVSRFEKELEISARYGLDKELFYKAMNLAYEQCGIGKFSHRALFEACRIIKPDVSENMLREWQALLLAPHFFPDTLAFLNELWGCDKILLTTGGEEFQNAKIAAHGLRKYFNAINIVSSPKAEHIFPIEPAIFIDDSPREIDAMKTLYHRAFCVLVRQTAPWEKQKDSLRADIRCHDLLSALEHIKKFYRGRTK